MCFANELSFFHNTKWLLFHALYWICVVLWVVLHKSNKEHETTTTSCCERRITHSAKYKCTSCLAYLMQSTTPSSSLFVHHVLNEPSEWISTLKFSNSSISISLGKNTLLLSMYCLTSSARALEIKSVLGEVRSIKNYEKNIIKNGTM